MHNQRNFQHHSPSSYSYHSLYGKRKKVYGALRATLWAALFSPLRTKKVPRCDVRLRMMLVGTTMVCQVVRKSPVKKSRKKNKILQILQFSYYKFVQEKAFIIHTLKGLTFSPSSSRSSTMHAMFLARVNIFWLSKQSVCGYT